MPETEKSLKKVSHSQYRWLRTGEQALSEMLSAIDAATTSIRFEMYIFHESPVASDFREALVDACQRGVKVQVLIDAMGSITLPESFWEPLKVSGGEFRWFNPLAVHRFSVRDHRKILVCDDECAFIGGFNIAPEYEGDGVVSGWRDLGLRVTGPIVRELAETFDEMFAIADFKQGFLSRWRKKPRLPVAVDTGNLLTTSPLRHMNRVKKALRTDLKHASTVRIISAYFLPTWRIRRTLTNIARHGGKVQLILPAKSDVPLMIAASRSLYRRFLQAGVEIYEYQPQVLHAKLIIIDNIVYAGSSNLDTRSLHLNYELMVRTNDPQTVKEAREIFAHDLRHCLRIDYDSWIKSRTFWTRLRQKWAYFVLARLDPNFTRWQLKGLR